MKLVATLKLNHINLRKEKACRGNRGDRRRLLPHSSAYRLYLIPSASSGDRSAGNPGAFIQPIEA